MRVVMVSTDRKLFDPASEVAKRTVALGNLLMNLHIVVFTRKSEKFSVTKLAPHVSVYPTNASTKLGYMESALAPARLVGNCEIVTAQDPFETGLAGLWIAREFKKPLQLQIHTDFMSPEFAKEGLLNKIRVRLARYTIPKATCVRVVSPRIAKSIEPLTAKLARPPSIIPVFTDIGKFLAGPTASLETAHPEFTFRIVMTSRLTPEKDIDLALIVLADLVKDHPSTGLFIIGDGPLMGRLKRKAKSYGVAQNVVFMGWMNDPAAVMRGCDLYLSTSKYEGFGLSILEAAAAGLPIVTSDVGLVGDTLKNGVDCLVCNPGDTDCFIRAIRTIKDTPGLGTQMGKAAKEVATPYAEETPRHYAEKIKADLAKCAAPAPAPIAAEIQ